MIYKYKIHLLPAVSPRKHFAIFLKRIVRALCLTAMTAAALTACGGGGGGGSNSQDASGANTTTDTTATPTTAAAETPTATAVGAPIGALVKKTIGAAGGDVTSDDGKFKVTIPAGALAADTDIGIQPIENKAFGGVGASYELTPDGQQFAQPVTLSFTYTDADLAGSAPEALAVAFQTLEGYWQLVDDISVDTVAKTVSATTPHFTRFASVERFRLDPPDKIVKVNTAALFSVLECYQPDAQGQGPSMGTDCYPIGATRWSEILSDWKVNGIPGGDSNYGTVVPQASQDTITTSQGTTSAIPHADYLAPSHVPDPRDVALSVNLKDPDNASSTVMLVANITVVVDAISGTVNFKGTRHEYGTTTNYHGQANLTYLTAEVSDSITRYDLPNDPAWAKISFDQWDVDDGSRVCHLVGKADTLIIPPTAPATPAGTLFTYPGLASYTFGALLSAKGTLQCVNPDDSVDTEPVEASVLLTTAATDMDPGFQPLGDGFPLVGSVNSTFNINEDGDTVTQAMDWSLRPVDTSQDLPQ